MKDDFFKGAREAIPVFLGYFAVSLSLGVNCFNAGLTPFQSSLMSLLNVTSAGEFAGVEIIASHGSYLELVLSQIVINLRYLLMSAVLTVNLRENTTTGQRLLMSYGITDEIFALSSAQKKPLNYIYTVGCFSMAVPGWVLGTLVGTILGDILPEILVQSLSLALYAMFIAIVVPPSRKNCKIALVSVFTIIISFVFKKLFPSVSSGMRVIILTVLISAMAAIIFPVEEQNE